MRTLNSDELKLEQARALGRSVTSQKPSRRRPLEVTEGLLPGTRLPSPYSFHADNMASCDVSAASAAGGGKERCMMTQPSSAANAFEISSSPWMDLMTMLRMLSSTHEGFWYVTPYPYLRPHAPHASTRANQPPDGAQNQLVYL